MIPGWLRLTPIYPGDGWMEPIADQRYVKTILGMGVRVLIAAVWWLQWRYKRGNGKLPALRWVLQVLAVAVVAMTGHLGGFLSGVNHP